MPGLEEQGGDGRSSEVSPERHQVLRWRAIASISQPDLDDLIADAFNTPNHELTTASVPASGLERASQRQISRYCGSSRDPRSQFQPN